MKITHDGKELVTKFTFNSFKYMEDLDMSELSELDNKPFKMIRITETLLLGALNNDQKVHYSYETASEILQEQANDGKLFEVLQYLMELLEKSSFFKSLQEPETPKIKEVKAKKE